jgi:hypothetical protein
MQQPIACSSNSTAPERRTTPVRREPATFPPKFSSQRRRRSRGRRKTDHGAYVDIYDRGSWILALTVLGLSFLDAMLTVYQIRKGVAREANPIMSMAIAWGGVYAFFSLKAALTAFPLAIIILHKEWTLARHMARLCLCFYVLILLYHMLLISGIMGATTILRSQF